MSQNVAVIEAARLPYPDAAARMGVESSAWQTLVNATFPTARTAEGVLLALNYCRARKLDVFKRPVHIVPIRTKIKNADGKEYWVDLETVWPGINELRTTAHRTGVYAGSDPAEWGPDITSEWELPSGGDDNGDDHPNAPPREKKAEAAPVKMLKVVHPEWCQITVYRLVQGQRIAFPGPRVYWRETYATAGKSDRPNEMWKDRARGQLEKCFSADTEVLTDLGFQKFSEVTGRILEVTDEGLKPTDATAFSMTWDGEMIYADGDGLDFCVTSNHDMLTTDGKLEAGFLYEHATSVAKFRIPYATQCGPKQDAPVSDNAIKLAAAFVCDGWARPYGSFCIGVSRPYKLDVLREMEGCKSIYTQKTAGQVAETEARDIKTKHDKTVFVFDEESLEGVVDLQKRFDVDLLLKLSRRQAMLLAQSMMLHDGADNGRGTLRFYSSRPDIMSAFEIIAVSAGLAVSKRRRRISDIGGYNWSITVSEKQSAPVIRNSPSQTGGGGLEKLPSTPGREVWCCRVPSGVIVVRRNGLSMLCGNCAEAAALRKAFPEELGGEHIVEEAPRMVEINPAAAAPDSRPDRTEIEAKPKAKGGAKAIEASKADRSAPIQSKPADNVVVTVDAGETSGPAKAEPTKNAELGEALEHALKVLDKLTVDEIAGARASVRKELSADDFAVWNTRSFERERELRGRR